MPSNLSPEIAALPLYRDGLDAGRDVGLAIALHVVVLAGVDQEQRANRTSPPVPANAHAATVLRKVADQVAEKFRETR